MPGMSESQVREILRLKEVEGLKPKQISEKLGIKHRTVSSVLYKQTHLYIHENKEAAELNKNQTHVYLL